METVRITDIAFGGDGVGHLADGKVAFVPFTAVGDLADVRVVSPGKSFSRCEMLSLREAGAGRAKPVCPYYGQCGGCVYQHLEYSAEIAAKSKQLTASLARIGRVDGDIQPEFFRSSPKRLGYRNKLRLEAFRDGDQVRYGFCQRDNVTFFPVKACPLADDSINRSLGECLALPWVARNGQTKTPLPLTIRHSSTGGMACYLGVTCKKACLIEKLAGLEVHVPVGSFWQVNPNVAPMLVSTLAEWLEPLPNGTLVDAYGGVGTFSLALGARFDHRIVIESDCAAAQCATLNHQEAGMKATILRHTTEAALGGALERLDASSTVVVLDPPRTGCLPAALEALLKHRPAVIAYVSCNPTTLARDLKTLGRAYRLTRLAAFDMFPATAHFETLVLLAREDLIHLNGDRFLGPRKPWTDEIGEVTRMSLPEQAKSKGEH